MNSIEMSVIIVAYNNLEIIIDCLTSIKKYNDIGDGLEVIVIDNSPEDKIYDFVKNQYRWVKIFKNENKGFGHGNNVGFSHSNGEYLLFLNPDTILIQPIFQFAIEKFSSNPMLGLFGVKLVDRQIDSNMSFYLIDKSGIIASIITKITNRINMFWSNRMYIAGANLFTRRIAFIKAGQFDEKIFMYYEEPDLCKRIKQSGYTIDFFKKIRIIHLEGQTTNNNSEVLIRRMAALKYYTNKYDVDYDKLIRGEIRYNKLKIIIFKLIQKDFGAVSDSIRLLNNMRIQHE